MTSPRRALAPQPMGPAAGSERHRRQNSASAPPPVTRPVGIAEAAPLQSPASLRDQEALLAARAAAGASRSVVRYRGFVLLPQADLGWLVRPERSPMTVLPFRTPPISLCDVKALVDWRLDGASVIP